jgi:hypothetical protein
MTGNPGCCARFKSASPSLALCEAEAGQGIPGNKKITAPLGAVILKIQLVFKLTAARPWIFPVP